MAKQRAYGADSTLRIARETTYGTAPGAGYTSLDFKSADLSSMQPLGDDPLLGRGRNAQDPFRGLVTDEGQIEIPFDLRATGFWLTGLFGDPVTTVEGTDFEHVWESGADAIPSYTVEIGHPLLTTPVFFRHPGTVMESLAFEMGQEGPANAMIMAVAQGEDSAAAIRAPANGAPVRCHAQGTAATGARPEPRRPS